MKQDLELHHYCEELRLKLLSEEHVVDYLAKRFMAMVRGNMSTLAPVIHARTDGNPLFMVNVVDYLLGKAGLAIPAQEVIEAEAMAASGFDTPRSIREMIERNLERLKPEEQAVLEGASVAGPEFSAASVAAALERPQDEIEACCVRLSRREQFVSTKGPITWPDGTIATGFRFHHALVPGSAIRPAPGRSSSSVSSADSGSRRSGIRRPCWRGGDRTRISLQPRQKQK